MAGKVADMDNLKKLHETLVRNFGSNNDEYLVPVATVDDPQFSDNFKKDYGREVELVFGEPKDGEMMVSLPEDLAPLLDEKYKYYAFNNSSWLDDEEVVRLIRSHGNMANAKTYIEILREEGQILEAQDETTDEVLEIYDPVTTNEQTVETKIPNTKESFPDKNYHEFKDRGDEKVEKLGYAKTKPITVFNCELVYTSLVRTGEIDGKQFVLEYGDVLRGDSSILKELFSKVNMSEKEKSPFRSLIAQANQVARSQRPVNAGGSKPSFQNR